MFHGSWKVRMAHVTFHEPCNLPRAMESSMKPWNIACAPAIFHGLTKSSMRHGISHGASSPSRRAFPARKRSRGGWASGSESVQESEELLTGQAGGFQVVSDN